jgi:hypothetical protein
MKISNSPPYAFIKRGEGGLLKNKFNEVFSEQMTMLSNFYDKYRANCKSLKRAPLPQPLPSRAGNTPLHPSQEGIYPLPWCLGLGANGSKRRWQV